jgi:hypothetical protein
MPHVSTERTCVESRQVLSQEAINQRAHGGVHLSLASVDKPLGGPRDSLAQYRQHDKVDRRLWQVMQEQEHCEVNGRMR